MVSSQVGSSQTAFKIHRNSLPGQHYLKRGDLGKTDVLMADDASEEAATSKLPYRRTLDPGRSGGPPV